MVNLVLLVIGILSLITNEVMVYQTKKVPGFPAPFNIFEAKLSAILLFYFFWIKQA